MKPTSEYYAHVEDTSGIPVIESEISDYTTAYSAYKELARDYPQCHVTLFDAETYAEVHYQAPAERE